MARVTVVLGVGAALLLGVAEAPAQDLGFDNPGSGSAPCLVLNRYQLNSGRDAAGAQNYTADVTMQNICGRSLDLEFCFRLAGGGEELEQACYGGVIRPWSSATIATEQGGTLIVGPDYRWRFLP